jgi:hypothetical protein
MLESNFIRGFVLLIGFIGLGASTTPKGHTAPPAHTMDSGWPPPCLPNTGPCGIQ